VVSYAKYFKSSGVKKEAPAALLFFNLLIAEATTPESKTGS
jgi:hypothetical protein